jgi:hypothetical protein
MAVLAPEGFISKTLDINVDEKSEEFGRLMDSGDGYPVQIYQADKALHEKFLNGILSALGLSRAA